MPKAKGPDGRPIRHARARVKSDAAKDGAGPPLKPTAAGMSDRQLMAALRRANPGKYAAPAKPLIATSANGGAKQTATESGEDTAAKNRTEREDRALAEVLATAGCTVGCKDHSDPEKRRRDVRRMFQESTGVKNEAIAGQLISHIATALTHGQLSSDFEKTVGAVAMMQEIKPANVNEALLACQMIGVHHAAMTFLYRATLSEQTFEGTDSNVLRATRLMRLYIDQTEAMARLKGKIGQQKVTVEHVHVHEGGRAIVGAVITEKPKEGEGGNEENSGKTPCIATRPAQEWE